MNASVRIVVLLLALAAFVAAQGRTADFFRSYHRCGFVGSASVTSDGKAQFHTFAANECSGGLPSSGHCVGALRSFAVRNGGCELSDWEIITPGQSSTLQDGSNPAVSGANASFVWAGPATTGESSGSTCEVELEVDYACGSGSAIGGADVHVCSWSGSSSGIGSVREHDFTAAQCGNWNPTAANGGAPCVPFVQRIVSKGAVAPFVSFSSRERVSWVNYRSNQSLASAESSVAVSYVCAREGSVAAAAAVGRCAATVSGTSGVSVLENGMRSVSFTGSQCTGGALPSGTCVATATQVNECGRVTELAIVPPNTRFNSTGGTALAWRNAAFNASSSSCTQTTVQAEFVCSPGARADAAVSADTNGALVGLIDGQTLVTFTGAFENATGTRCRFGDATSDAVFVSETTAQCRAPSATTVPGTDGRTVELNVNARAGFAARLFGKETLRSTQTRAFGSTTGAAVGMWLKRSPTGIPFDVEIEVVDAGGVARTFAAGMNLSSDTLLHLMVSKNNATREVAVEVRSESQELVANRTVSYTSEQASPPAAAFSFAERFRGHIDEVQVWRAVPDAAARAEYARRKLRGDENGLEMYWSFDEGAGTALADGSGHGLVGELADGVVRGGRNISAAWERSPASVYAERAFSFFYYGHNASRSIAFGQGAVDATAGAPATFTIQAVDRFGNNRTSGETAVFAVSLSHQAASGREYPSIHPPVLPCPNCSSLVNDLKDGRYVVSYTPRLAGSYRLALAFEGVAAAGSPLSLSVRPAATQSGQSIAFGSGLTIATAGVATQFTVQARDSFANNKTAGGDTFVANLNGPTQLSVTGGGTSPVSTPVNTDVKLESIGADASDGSGTYTVTYTPEVAGTWQMTVKRNASGSLEPIGSASGVFTPLVYPGPTNTSRSIAYGGALSRTTAGTAVTFTIQAQDAFGNLRTQGNDVFNVTLQGPATLTQANSSEVLVTDNQNGTYTVRYYSHRKGDFQLRITRQGSGTELIAPGTAPVPRVEPAPTYPGTSSASGAGLSTGTAGQESSFIVQSRDIFGNDRTSGGDSFSVTIQGLKKDLGGNPVDVSNVTVQPSSLQDRSDGTYVVRYTVPAAGHYNVSVQLTGTAHVNKSLNGSPYALVVYPSGTAATESIAYGTGLQVATAGVTARFAIQARDSLGNNKTSHGDRFRVHVDGPDRFEYVGGDTLRMSDVGHVEMLGNVTDRNDQTGLYDVTYVPTVAGSYIVTVGQINGTTVLPIQGGGRFTLQVHPADLNVSQSLVYGRARVAAIAGENSSVVVAARDSFGNLRTQSSGANAFAVSLTGGPGSARDLAVHDRGDGSYIASYTADTAGAYTLNITAGAGAGSGNSGKSAEDAPFAVAVQAAETNASRSTFAGPGATAATAGEEVQFTINAADSFGNARTMGHDVFEVRLFGRDTGAPWRNSIASRLVRGDVVDRANGTYTVKYTPEVAGEYSMHVEALRESALASPFATANDSVTRENECFSVASVVSSLGIALRQEADRRAGGAAAADESFFFDGYVSVRGIVEQLSDSGSSAPRFAVYFTAEINDEYTLNVSASGGLLQPGATGGESSSTLIESPDMLVGTCATSTAARNVTLNRTSERPDFFLPSSKPRFWVEMYGPLKLNGTVRDASGEDFVVALEALVNDWTDIRVMQPVYANVSNSPRDVRVHAAALDVGRSFAYGDGLVKATSGQQSSFTIQTVDRFSNNRTLGSATFRAQVTGPQSVEADVQNNTDGTYRVSWTPTVIGNYQVDVTSGGVRIGGSPFSVPVFPNGTDATKTIAYGTGLEAATAGVEAVFTVQARDKFGNNRTDGNEVFRAEFSGGRRRRVQGGPTRSDFLYLLSDVSSTTVTAQDQGDGTYILRYTLPFASTYTLKIYLGSSGEQLISNGERNVTVLPGPTSPAHSVPVGQGLKLGTAGALSTLKLQATDQFGTPRTQGRDSFEIKITPGQGVSGSEVAGTVADESDGTYTMRWRSEVAGNPFVVKISQNGTEVKKEDVGSDYLAEVLPNSSNAPNTFASGAGTSTATAGALAHFVVQTVDEFGNTRSQSGDRLVVLLHGPNTTTYTDGGVSLQETKGAQAFVNATEGVAGLSNGRYNVTFNATVAGAYNLSVLLQDGGSGSGQHIKGSPFALRVHPSTTETRLGLAYGVGLTLSTAGNAAQFTVRSRDRFGNLRESGGDTYTVLVDAGDGVNVTGSVADNANGTYTVTYNATVRASYSVIVSSGGVRISEGNTRTAVVHAGVASSAQTFAAGSSLAQTTAGTVSTFTIQARDRFGNNRTKEGDSFAVAIVGPAIRDSSSGAQFEETVVAANATTNATVQDLADGSGQYRVTFNSVTAGPHRIAVTRVVGSGAQASHEPLRDGGVFAPHVYPAETNTSETIAVGAGLASATAGAAASFTIRVKDRFGNFRTRGGDTFQVTVQGPESLAAAMSDGNNGQHAVSYTPQLAGEYVVFVNRSGSPIDGMPFVAHVRAAAVNGTSCTAHGAGLRVATAGAFSRFVVVARDTFGNARSQGGDSVAVTVATPTGASVTASADNVTVTDRGDGTYGVAYNATVAAAYDIAVSVGGSALAGSPWRATVHPGAAAPLRTVISGAGASGATAGAEASFSVQARDRFCNSRTRGGDEFTAEVGGHARHAAATTDHGNGAYTLKYTTQTSSDNRDALVGVNHTLAVRIGAGETPATASPLPVTVQPAATSAAHTVAHGRGTGAGTAGDVLSFAVIARDQFGNLRTQGGDSFVAEVAQPGGGSAPSAQVHSYGDGTYRVSVVPEKSGGHSVSVELGASAIIGSAFTPMVQQGESAAANATASGDGLARATAGEAAAFTVVARDRFGNVRTQGDERFFAAMSGANGTISDMASASVAQSGAPASGTSAHVFGYTPTRAGNYTLAVTGERVPPRGMSPFFAQTSDSDAAARKCAALGTLLSAFLVDLQKDFYYGRVSRVRLSGPVYLDGSVRALAGGQYEVSYTATVLGQSSFAAMHLDGRATSERVADAPAERAGSYQTLGACLDASFAVSTGGTASSPVHAEGDVFAVSVAGPLTLDGSVRDGNGTNQYGVRIGAVGGGAISVETNPRSLATGRAFSPEVFPGKMNVSSTVAFGSGLRAGVAGETSSLVVQARDRFGNLLTRHNPENATAEFSVRAVPDGNASAAVSGSVQDLGDGRFLAQYTPTAAGTHRVHVLFGGVAVLGSPFATTISPAAADASRSSVAGKGLRAGTAGVLASVTVTARDRFGNLLTRGGDDFAVLVAGRGANSTLRTQSTSGIALTVRVQSAGTGNATDFGNGTYVLSYVAERAGLYDVRVVLGASADVSGSPSPAAKIEPDVLNATLTSAVGAGLTIGTAGDNPAFLLHARDRFGNARTSGGDKFVVQVRGPDRIRVFGGHQRHTVRDGGNFFNGTVADVGNGTYAVSYNATIAGAHQLNASADGHLVSGKPFAPTIYPSVTNADSVIAYGQALFHETAGNLAKFTIETVDRFGNPRTRGDNTFEVQVDGPNSNVFIGGPTLIEQVGPFATPNETIANQNNGKYVVSFNATVAGNYSITVRMVGGSGYVSGQKMPICRAVAPLPSTCPFNATEDAVRAGNYSGTYADCRWDEYTTCSYILPPQCSPAQRIHGFGRTTPIQNYVECAQSNGGVFKSHIFPARTHTQTTLTRGQGLYLGTAGETTQFYIVARDRYGNLRTRGDDSWKVVFTGIRHNVSTSPPEPLSCTFWSRFDRWSTSSRIPLPSGSTSNDECVGIGAHATEQHVLQANVTNVWNNGTYLVQVNATVSGLYQVNVTRDNILVRDHCFEYARRGDGLCAASDVNHTDADITVNGEPNGLARNASLGVDSQLYVGVYWEPYQMLLKPNRVWPLTSFSFMQNTTAVPAHGQAIQQGLVLATAGHGAAFRVQARDFYGNNRTEGGDKFFVVAEGPDTYIEYMNETAPPCIQTADNGLCKRFDATVRGSLVRELDEKYATDGQVTDLNNGTYAVWYNTTVAGDFKVLVRLENDTFADVSSQPQGSNTSTTLVATLQTDIMKSAPSAQQQEAWASLPKSRPSSPITETPACHPLSAVLTSLSVEEDVLNTFYKASATKPDTKRIAQIDSLEGYVRDEGNGYFTVTYLANVTRMTAAAANNMRRGQSYDASADVHTASIRVHRHVFSLNPVAWQNTTLIPSAQEILRAAPNWTLAENATFTACMANMSTSSECRSAYCRRNATVNGTLYDPDASVCSGADLVYQRRCVAGTVSGQTCTEGTVYETECAMPRLMFMSRDRERHVEYHNITYETVCYNNMSQVLSNTTSTHFVKRQAGLTFNHGTNNCTTREIARTAIAGPLSSLSDDGDVFHIRMSNVSLALNALLFPEISPEDKAESLNTLGKYTGFDGFPTDYSVRYDAVVDLVRLGNATLSVTQQRRATRISGAPHTMLAKPDIADAKQTIVYGLGILQETAGYDGKFTIQMKDRYTNNRTVGGEQFRLSFVGPNTLEGPAEPRSLNVTDNQNGTVTVSYNNFVSGLYYVGVELNQSTSATKPVLASGFTHIKPSPFDGSRKMLTLSQDVAIMREAKLTPSASSVLITLDAGDTSTVGTKKRCIDDYNPSSFTLDCVNNMFDNRTKASFGAGFVDPNDQRCGCVRTSEFTFTLNLCEDATAIPGDDLQLNPNIYNWREPFCNGVTRLEQPDDPLIPRSIVNAPAEVAICDSLTLNGQQSSGSGGRPIKYEWSVRIVESQGKSQLSEMSAETQSSFANLTARLGVANSTGYFPASSLNAENPKGTKVWPTRQTGNPLLSINAANELVSGTTYEFTLTVKNYLFLFNPLTFRAHSSTKIVKTTDLPIPNVLISGDPVRDVLRSEDNFFEGYAELSSCVPEGKRDMTFQWALSKNSPHGHILTLDARTRETRKLTVPKGTLKVGRTYLFEVTGAMVENPLISNVAQLNVTVVPSPITTTVAGGDQRRLPRLSEIVLDASVESGQTVDPDEDPTVAQDAWQFAWTCKQIPLNNNPQNCRTPPYPGNTNGLVDTTCACLTTTMITCDDASQAVCFKPLTMPTTGKVVLEPVLPGDRNYSFTVQAKRGSRTATDSQTVEIAQGNPPIVSVTSITGKVNSNERLTLQGSSRVLDDQGREVQNVDVKYRWTLPADPPLQSGKTFASVASTGTEQQNLVINADSLVPGSTYQFTLFAFANEAEGSASVTVVVNRPPSGGKCVVYAKAGELASDASAAERAAAAAIEECISPTCTPNGTALNTTFHMTCTDWTDDPNDLPLRYNFLVDNGNGTATLNDINQANFFESVMPTGKGANNTLKLIGYVFDKFNGKSDPVEMTIIVRTPGAGSSASQAQASTEAAKGALSNTVSSAQQTGDNERVTGTLNSMASVLNDATKSASTGQTSRFPDGPVVMHEDGRIAPHRTLAEAEDAQRKDEASSLRGNMTGITLTVTQESAVTTATVSRLTKVVEESTAEASEVSDSSRNNSMDTADTLLTGIGESSDGLEGDAAQSMTNNFDSIYDSTSELDQEVEAMFEARREAVRLAREAAEAASLAARARKAVSYAGSRPSLRLLSFAATAAVDRVAGMLGGETANVTALRVAEAVALAAAANSSATGAQAALQNIANRTVGMIDQIAQATTKSRVAGEASVNVTSNNVKMQSTKLFSSQAGGSSLAAPGTASGSKAASFQLPTSASSNSSSSTGAQVVAFGKNPYRYIEKKPTSNTTSLNLRNPDGSPIEFANLLEPVKIVLPVQTQSVNPLQKALDGGIQRCTFWRAEQEQWSDDGCLIQYEASDHTLCLCYHLSTFSTTEETVLPEMNLVNPVGDIGQLGNLFDSLEFALIFIIVVYLLFIAVVGSFYGRHKDEKELAAEKQKGEDDEEEDPEALRGQLKQKILEQHSLLSVLYRPMESSYTRPMRIATLLATWMGDLMLNAVFFQLQGPPGEDEDKTANFVENFQVGVITALVMIPASILFEWMFKKSSKLNEKKAKSKERDMEETERAKQRRDRRRVKVVVGGETVEVDADDPAAAGVLATDDGGAESAGAGTGAGSGSGSGSSGGEGDDSHSTGSDTGFSEYREQRKEAQAAAEEEEDLDEIFKDDCERYEALIEKNRFTKEYREQLKRRMPYWARETHWFLWLSYFVVYLWICFCGIVNMLFGLQFTPQQRFAWLFATGTALMMDMLVNEPMKIWASTMLKGVLKEMKDKKQADAQKAQALKQLS